MNEFEGRARRFREAFFALSDEIGKVIVGQKGVVENVLTCLFAGGNALLEGVPGLGKTLLVRSLAEAVDLPFSRIQFTPDLMPADILGTDILQIDETGQRNLVFRKGPLFSNLVLADEINRATPKTQSALLEAMQERSITVGGTTYRLEEPFLVLATQNPLEMEGTYLLPEAQLDRFLLKIDVPFVSLDEMNEILGRTTGVRETRCRKVLSGGEILGARRVAREVVVPPEVQDHVSRIVLATHPELPGSPEPARKYFRWGASPRGAQAMLLAGKIQALVAERYNVSFEDVRRVALECLRHRVALSFEAQAEGVREDQVLAAVLGAVPIPRAARAG